MGRKRSLEVSPKVRLVDDAEVDRLLQRFQSVQWRPENGFLRDLPATQEHRQTGDESRAA
jgi:hypothetical protein